MRQREVSQSHWKGELRPASSHWGERAAWNRASEPGLVQGPGCSCPVHRGMAERSIRTATLKPLYVSRSDDKLDLQGVVRFFLLALCVILMVCKGTGSHWTGRFTFSYQDLSQFAWVETTEKERQGPATPERRTPRAHPAWGSPGKGCKLPNNKYIHMVSHYCLQHLKTGVHLKCESYCAKVQISGQMQTS